MPKIFEHINPADPMLKALNDFLLMMDATLPSNQNIRFYLSGGMLVYLYTGCQRTFYIEGEFNRKVYIADGLSLVYRDGGDKERLIRFNKNDNTRFNLMHPNYLQDAVLLPFKQLQNMQVHALTALDLCVSKISRLSPIDIEDIQGFVRAGYFSAEELDMRAREALIDYFGDLKQYRDNISLAKQYAQAAQSALS